MQKEEQFNALRQRNERTIRQVCWSFFPRDAYNYKSLYAGILLRLWEQMDKVGYVESESAWVHQLALRYAINEYRREKNQPQLLEITETMADTLPEIRSDESRQQLEELMTALKPQDKSILNLYLSGYTSQEMAQMLDRRKGAIEVQIHRIKQKLIKMQSQIDNR